jgi:hypothetical protein
MSGAMDSGLSTAFYFDGTSSKRRTVALCLGEMLEIEEDGQRIAAWPYADIRRADDPWRYERAMLAAWFDRQFGARG